jgi:hypothetical protein
VLRIRSSKSRILECYVWWILWVYLTLFIVFMQLLLRLHVLALIIISQLLVVLLVLLFYFLLLRHWLNTHLICQRVQVKLYPHWRCILLLTKLHIILANWLHFLLIINSSLILIWILWWFILLYLWPCVSYNMISIWKLMLLVPEERGFSFLWRKDCFY